MSRWFCTLLVLGMLVAQTKAQAQTLATFKWHTNTITSVAFSTDSKILASGSADKTICLWDLRRLTLRRVLRAHTAQVNCVAFSPDGKTLVSGAFDRTIKVWNTQDFTEVKGKERYSEDNNISDLLFSPDGRLLVSRGYAGEIRFWNADTMELRFWLAGFPGVGHRLRFSPKGQWLVFTGEKGVLKAINLRTRKAEVVEKKDRERVINWLGPRIVSPDGKIFATINLLRDAKTKEVVATFHYPDFHFFRAFSPDGKMIAATAGKATDTTVDNFEILLLDVAKLLEQNKK